MARLYTLLKPDGSLLCARQKGRDWVIASGLPGAEANGRNVTVFLNGLDVLGLSAVIPARNENQARRAAPFAVEDDLAETVEASHVALSPPDKSNPSLPRRINIASVDALKELTEQLSKLGLSEAEIVAAHSVLPTRDILVEAPGLLLGRLGGRSFAVDASIGRDVVVGLLDKHADAEIHGAHLAQAVGRNAQGEGISSLESFLLTLANWAEAGDTAINLRQGAFAPRRSVDLGGLQQWRFAGGLAAVMALGWFGSMIIETGAMNTRAVSLENLSTEFARVGWPEADGDVQQVLALSANTRVTNAQKFPPLLDASAILYDALSQVEGSELRTIRYDRLRGQMTASVAFESFADVDRLTAIINGSGLEARSGDSRQSGSKVIGDLTLESAS
ncbi:MAG: type II secretion system protein GspL [Pseudomonadota bacterium]